MKWMINYLKKFSYFFDGSLSQIILVTSLFVCDILVILGDFSAFFAIPELLPTVITVVVITYFWRKIKQLPIGIRVKHFLFFFLIWNFTYEWINPFSFPENKNY